MLREFCGKYIRDFVTDKDALLLVPLHCMSLTFCICHSHVVYLSRYQIQYLCYHPDLDSFCMWNTIQAMLLGVANNGLDDSVMYTSQQIVVISWLHRLKALACVTVCPYYVLNSGGPKINMVLKSICRLHFLICRPQVLGFNLQPSTAMRWYNRRLCNSSSKSCNDWCSYNLMNNGQPEAMEHHQECDFALQNGPNWIEAAL